jgi:hypothetical protein
MGEETVSISWQKESVSLLHYHFTGRGGGGDWIGWTL